MIIGFNFLMMKKFVGINVVSYLLQLYSRRCEGNMSGADDVKEHVDVDGNEDNEKSVPSSEQEVVFLFWIIFLLG